MSPTTTTTPITYKIDPMHAAASFKVRHMMVANVRGEFSGVTGTVMFDPSNPANSHVDVIIDAKTIHTREDQRDAHLKSPDFLDVEKFPTITFVSQNVVRTGEGESKVSGDLTIHGVTRSVTLDVEGPSAEAKDPWGNMRSGATATTKINRKDFGLVWNQALETGGVLVGEDVHIQIEAELMRS